MVRPHHLPLSVFTSGCSQVVWRRFWVPKVAGSIPASLTLDGDAHGSRVQNLICKGCPAPYKLGQG